MLIEPKEETIVKTILRHYMMDEDRARSIAKALLAGDIPYLNLPNRGRIEVHR